MKSKFSLISYAALLLLSTLNLQLSTFAQGTAFTYQGRLNSSGSPANGSYDVSFALFGASSGGGAIAGPATNVAVGVTNGLFTTLVNFGNAFTGTSNWLELAVSTNGANAFFTLAPRQQLTPVPYAIYAETANAAGLTGTGFFSGNVGIGVTNPVDLLDVATGGVIGNSTTSVASNDPSNRGTKVSFGYRDPFGGDFNGMSAVVNPGSLCGNSGDLLFYTWACNFSTTREVMRINGAGNVGIGVTNPATTLQVNGTVTATTFSGSGSGLTGLNGANVSGVALLAGANTFTGTSDNFTGTVGIGSTVNASSELSIGQTGGQTQLELLKPGSNLGYQFATDSGGLGICERNIACGRFYIQNGTGNVGIGTASPQYNLSVGNGMNIDQNALNSGTVQSNAIVFGPNSFEGIASKRTSGGNQFDLEFYTFGANRMEIQHNGNVGIGTTSPDALLSVNGTADKPGGGSWTTFSDGRLKDVGAKFTHGLEDLATIQPVHYHYKSDNPLNLPSGPEYVGVVAQQVQQAVPEAVQQSQTGYLTVNNDPIIWTMVNAIKELNQKVEAKDTENAELKARLDKLEQLLNSKSGEAK